MGTVETQWHRACLAAEIDLEDVIEVTIEDRTCAIYHLENGFYATDGLCSHEKANLADGLVVGDLIECPKHNARFHIPTGKAVRKPARTPLGIYRVRKIGEEIFIGFPESGQERGASEAGSGE